MLKLIPLFGIRNSSGLLVASFGFMIGMRGCSYKKKNVSSYQMEICFYLNVTFFYSVLER